MKILIAATVFFAVVFAIAGFKNTPNTSESSVSEKTDVLLRTCFPAPDYKYKNAAPLCNSFKKYITSEVQSHE